MKKLLITDVGEVLVKTDKAIISCIKKACEMHGFVGSKKRMLNVFGISIYVISNITQEKKVIL